MPNNSAESSDKSQSDKFKDLARELETNEDEAAFDRALKKIAKSPPPDKGSKPDKDKPAK